MVQVKVSSGRLVSLGVWDTAGAERFESLSRMCAPAELHVHVNAAQASSVLSSYATLSPAACLEWKQKELQAWNLGSTVTAHLHSACHRGQCFQPAVLPCQGYTSQAA